MSVDADGKVGIGGIPFANFHVQDEAYTMPSLSSHTKAIFSDSDHVYISLISASSGAIQFGDTANENIAFINYDHSTDKMFFRTNNVDTMCLDSEKVGIGTTSPATSALLELSSTTGALLVPRMTTTQRNALTALEGMIIYNTTAGNFEGYNWTGWATLS